MDKYRYKYKHFFEFYKKISKLNNFDEVQNNYKIIIDNVECVVERKLINSLINKNRYIAKIDFEKFLRYINIIENIKYYHDTFEIMEEILKITNEPSQINTLKRLILKKPINENLILKKTNSSKKKIVKKCPHCNNPHLDFENIDYVICGYTSKGFDWKGCGYDWCFQCNKKLCKCWNIDELFNKLNRYHDESCCRLHALRTGNKYPDDYCQCYNKHVRRNYYYNNAYY